MQCFCNTSFSNDWVNEKITCINKLAKERTQEIVDMLNNKHKSGDTFLTPSEFTKILVFKGLARSKKKFLKLYKDNNTVQNITSIIFKSGLKNYRFEDTEHEQQPHIFEAICS